MKLDVRKTTPLTRAEAADLVAFAEDTTAEHAALVRMAPVAVRSNSEGSTLRALTLLGMLYVRRQMDSDSDVEAAYAELAQLRPADHARADRGLRRNVRRMAEQG